MWLSFGLFPKWLQTVVKYEHKAFLSDIHLVKLKGKLEGKLKGKLKGKLEDYVSLWRRFDVITD